MAVARVVHRGGFVATFSAYFQFGILKIDIIYLLIHSSAGFNLIFMPLVT